MNWENDGKELFEFLPRSVIRNLSYYFKPSVSCGALTSSINAFRYIPKGFIPDVNTRSIFFDEKLNISILNYLQSNTIAYLIQMLNPTLAFNAEQCHSLPYIKVNVSELAESCVFLAKNDWDSYETSWDFTQNPIIRTQQPNLKQAFNTWQQQNADAVAEMKRLEEENNKLFLCTRQISQNPYPIRILLS